MSSEPAVASSALSALLDGPEQPARLLGASPAAAYLVAGDDVLAVVTPAAVRLPNAVVTQARVVAAAAAPFLVGGGGIVLGTVRLEPRRWWDPRPRLGRVSPAVLCPALDELERALPPWHPAGAHVPVLQRAAAELGHGLVTGDTTAVRRAATRLTGLGPGLTPAGDDVVAGALAALRLLGPACGAPGEREAHQLAAAARSAATRTTALSAALVGHAAHGEVAAPAAGLLRALAGRGDVHTAARGLLRVGHTSGHDLARGILAGGRAVAAHCLAGTR